MHMRGSDVLMSVALGYLISRKHVPNYSRPQCGQIVVIIIRIVYNNYRLTEGKFIIYYFSIDAVIG